MDWIITEENKLTPADVDRQGNKLLIGNGYISYRGTLEEYNKKQKTATIVSGLYDQVGDQWREPINLPNGGYIQVIYQGEALHALNSKVVSHAQSLDMHSAVHTRQTTFKATDGTLITIQARRFTSLAHRHLICMEYSVHTDRPCVIDLLTGVDGDVWDINGPHLEQVCVDAQDGLLSVSAVTHENAVPLAVSEAILLPAQPSLPVTQHIEKNAAGTRINRLLEGIQLEQHIVLYKFVSHVTGLDDPDPLAASRALCKEAAELGFAALLNEQTALWSQRWADCDIQIEGDATAQQALSFSMYHLLAVVPTHSERVSIAARGMSGQMYKGAIFWDTEMFMLPFFTYAFPRLARNLLLYRYHTLDGARRKAREFGYRGAFYAWESQETGDDACTFFAITDVITNRLMRNYFRDKQVHISADIVYAFWQYFIITGDASIWQAGGAEVVFECARFFLSYSYYNPDKQRYEILDVIGPDEYHERVHNNAFTNRMVAYTLEVCLKVAEYLRVNSPEFLDKLIQSLDFERDLERIADIATKIYLPDIVEAGKVIPQFDGYFKLEDVALPDLLKRKLLPNEYLGGGNGLATTTQIIKQADVVLMTFLFSDLYPLETKTANWEYYEPRTEHGSSLSPCSYSLVAAQIGKVDWAYKYFMKTATIDLSGEGRQYIGTTYIGGIHSAANGGAWMAAVFGLCGVRYNGELLIIDPHLPAHWQKVTLPLMIAGQKLHITLTHDKVTVKRLNSLKVAISVKVGEMVYRLGEKENIKIP